MPTSTVPFGRSRLRWQKFVSWGRMLRSPVQMPRILVTNDDGVHAPGIKALADAMRSLGDVIVVAPHQESSAIGHALTLRRPLRLETFGPDIYAVDGTPTDCVNIAVAVLPSLSPGPSPGGRRVKSTLPTAKRVCSSLSPRERDRG